MSRQRDFLIQRRDDDEDDDAPCLRLKAFFVSRAKLYGVDRVCFRRKRANGVIIGVERRFWALFLMN